LTGAGLPDAEITLGRLADKMRGAVAFDAKLIGIHSGGALTMDAWTLVHSWYRHFEGRRMLHGTAHDVLMAAPVLGDYFRAVGVIPASRAGVTAALAAGHDVIVGRDVRADVRVAHPLISRTHLLVRFDQGRWVAVDNGSLNGLYVQHRRVPAVDIQDGMRVNIGNPDGPALIYTRAEIEALMDEAKGGNHVMSVDLETQTVTAPSGKSFRFEIDPVRKAKMLKGLDAIGETLQKAGSIDTYEMKRALAQPWLEGA